MKIRNMSIYGIVFAIAFQSLFESNDWTSKAASDRTPHIFPEKCHWLRILTSSSFLFLFSVSMSNKTEAIIVHIFHSWNYSNESLTTMHPFASLNCVHLSFPYPLKSAKKAFCVGGWWDCIVVCWRLLSLIFWRIHISISYTGAGRTMLSCSADLQRISFSRHAYNLLFIWRWSLVC